MQNFTRLLVLFAISICFADVSSGQSAATKTESPSDAEITALVEKLHSPRFSERRAASIRLNQMGRRAHAHLEKMTLEGNAEASTRALDLLRRASNQTEREIAESARRSLQRIAKSDRPIARAAERALQSPSSRDAALPLPVMPRVPLRLPPAPIIGPPPPFGPAPRNNLRISIKTINGVREIEVVQNNQTFRFRDVAGGLEIERPDGKGGFKKSRVQNSEALRRKDREAYEAYQRAGGDKAGRAIGGIMKIRQPPQ